MDRAAFPTRFIPVNVDLCSRLASPAGCVMGIGLPVSTDPAAPAPAMGSGGPRGQEIDDAIDVADNLPLLPIDESLR
jgi:hypothetical protein